MKSGVVESAKVQVHGSHREHSLAPRKTARTFPVATLLALTARTARNTAGSAMLQEGAHSENWRRECAGRIVARAREQIAVQPVRIAAKAVSVPSRLLTGGRVE